MPFGSYQFIIFEKLSLTSICIIILITLVHKLHLAYFFYIIAKLYFFSYLPSTDKHVYNFYLKKKPRAVSSVHKSSLQRFINAATNN